MSFTNQYLKFRELKIYDANGFEIPNFSRAYSEQKYVYPFRPPVASIMLDVTEIISKEPDKPDREVLDKYEDIQRRGYKIVSVKAYNKWLKRQRVVYRLILNSDMIRGALVYRTIPQGHKVILDVKKKLVRIQGPNAGKRFRGPWLPVVEEED